MYFDGGMENVSEPRFISREGRGRREDTALELKEREPSIALLSDDILAL
jgi:hypothetical protein